MGIFKISVFILCYFCARIILATNDQVTASNDRHNLWRDEVRVVDVP